MMKWMEMSQTSCLIKVNFSVRQLRLHNKLKVLFITDVSDDISDTYVVIEGSSNGKFAYLICQKKNLNDREFI